MKRAFLIWGLILSGLPLIGQNNVTPSSSSASFRVKNLGLWVKGQIRGLYGEVRLEQDSSFIRVTLDTRAIRTGNKVRDRHLLEERFFDEALYPTLTFVSDSIATLEGGYVAYGQLTIKDVTQSIEVPFSGSNHEYTGAFTINRKEFHVDNGEFITKGIGDAVEVNVTIQIDPYL